MDFVTLAIYVTVFGFTIGAYVGLTSVILVDLLGLERLTNAFGLLLLFQGIASLVGPPIAGKKKSRKQKYHGNLMIYLLFSGEMYDALLSYDPGFYLSGVTIGISGLMLFFIPCLQRWQQKKRASVSANI